MHAKEFEQVLLIQLHQIFLNTLKIKPIESLSHNNYYGKKHYNNIHQKTHQNINKYHQFQVKQNSLLKILAIFVMKKHTIRKQYVILFVIPLHHRFYLFVILKSQQKKIQEQYKKILISYNIVALKDFFYSQALQGGSKGRKGAYAFNRQQYLTIIVRPSLLTQVKKQLPLTTFILPEKTTIPLIHTKVGFYKSCTNYLIKHYIIITSNTYYFIFLRSCNIIFC
eukprot:TRINITY_DN150_c5_g1_i1.p1 TRINITY_DN150_c5_g1~~TRINITY_DN150_c5_g1_i1.p1  ORF type:complete len:224 (+),score=-20.88 TRINITY_DN150_c5_g1_i1:341-1012(+)